MSRESVSRAEAHGKPVSALTLEVADAVGVSPVGRDTRLLAERALELGGRSVLDMGTGTGFVAIYLALRGVEAEGVDINPAAIRCARENARAHRVDVAFLRSDLFEALARSYDLIVFNPPYGHSGSAGSTRWLEVIKSLLPKENPIVSRIAYRLVRGPRIRLIRRFLRDCREHLCEEGRVLLLLHQSEVSLTNDLSPEIIDRHNDLRLLVLRPSRSTIPRLPQAEDTN